MPGIFTLHHLSHFGNLHVCHRGYHARGLLPCRNHRLKRWASGEKSLQINGFDNFKEFVACIVFQSSHTGGGIIEGDMLLREESLDFFQTIGALLRVLELESVGIKNMPHNFPHIVCLVRVEKFHRPSVWLWRESTQHQHSCPIWQKRREWVALYR